MASSIVVAAVASPAADVDDPADGCSQMVHASSSVDAGGAGAEVAWLSSHDGSVQTTWPSTGQTMPAVAGATVVQWASGHGSIPGMPAMGRW